jgi:hypothetical protein
LENPVIADGSGNTMMISFQEAYRPWTSEAREGVRGIIINGGKCTADKAFAGGRSTKPQGLELESVTVSTWKKDRNLKRH